MRCRHPPHGKASLELRDRDLWMLPFVDDDSRHDQGDMVNKCTVLAITSTSSASVFSVGKGATTTHCCSQ